MKTVLCVDDQAVGLEIRKSLLETRGFKVLTALTGAEALSAVRRESIDLVILDYKLAETTGEEVARDLKREQPKLPILLLSGYPSLPSTAHETVDFFVPKGMPTAEFLQAVESLLGLRTAGTSRKAIEVSHQLREKSSSSRKDNAAIVDLSRRLLRQSRELFERSQEIVERWHQRNSRLR